LEGNPGPGSRVTPDDRSPTESTEEVTNSDA
jgi:hypothetical protein